MSDQETPDQMTSNFVKEMLDLGIVHYNEQETLWKLAKRCAGTLGLVGAGTWGAYGASGGVPGAVSGALAGLFYGTATCTIASLAVREQLRELAREPSE